MPTYSVRIPIVITMSAFVTADNEEKVKEIMENACQINVENEYNDDVVSDLTLELIEPFIDSPIVEGNLINAELNQIEIMEVDG